MKLTSQKLRSLIRETINEMGEPHWTVKDKGNQVQVGNLIFREGTAVGSLGVQIIHSYDGTAASPGAGVFTLNNATERQALVNWLNKLDLPVEVESDSDFPDDL